MSEALNFISSAFYAFLGGLIPSLIWLYFWHRENQKNPQSKSTVLLAFFGGIVAVSISLVLEKFAFSNGHSMLSSLNFFKPLLEWLKNVSIENAIEYNKLILVVVFAPFIEEISKFLMALLFVLGPKREKWPIDPIILMITTALGFSALENSLFLMEPFIKGQMIEGIITGNLRFIGATLLHTVSSATIGFFIGFNFFDKFSHKVLWTILGVLCAIIVHAIFNFLMIGSDQSSFIALELIWVAVIIVLLAFEKIKRIKIEKINP